MTVYFLFICHNSGVSLSVVAMIESRLYFISAGGLHPTSWEKFDETPMFGRTLRRGAVWSRNSIATQAHAVFDVVVDDEI